MYFRFNHVTVFACIFVTIIVSVNGMDVFPLTDISVTLIVNGKNTVYNHESMTSFRESKSNPKWKGYTLQGMISFDSGRQMHKRLID